MAKRRAASRLSFRAKNNRNRNSLKRRKLTAGLEMLEGRQMLAGDVTLFVDSFESGSNSNDWAGNWVEDSQNDWFRSTQRSSDGARSAEVDGRANNATLMLSDPVNLSGYDSAELTFDWLIESGFDRGEYLALDVSSNGGASWNTSVLQLDGNSDPENQWISETVDLTPYASSELLIRFRSQVSRSNEDANVDNVRITGQQSGTTFPATIAYPDFSDSSGLTLLGDAAIAGGNTLRLTLAVEGVNGAAWHADKQFVSVDWETSFDFNLNENVGDIGGSDGFAFIIQNHAATYLKGGGGTLGYEALPNSLAIEFDTFQNIENNLAFSDTSQSAISIQTAGTGPNFPTGELSIASYDTPAIMDDAQTHHVRITYVDKILSVFYDNLATPVIETAIDLDGLLDLDAGQAWLGFTAATGGGYQNHDILNWEYRVLADTSSTVAISNASVIEGDSGVNDLIFDVVRTGDTSQPATLDWALVAASAAAGVDYLNDSGSLSFAAGEDVKSIVVGVNGDSEEEDHETLQVQLENLSSGILVVDSASGTILNDDTSISINNATVTEGDGLLSLLGNFVGEGIGGLSTPRLSTFGPDGNDDGVQDFYIVSAASDQVLRYDGSNGAYIDAFVSDEPLFDNGLGLAFSPLNGDLFVVSGSSVLRFDRASGNLVETVVSGLDNPAGVAFFESGPRFGDLLITERNTDKVLIFDGTSVSDFVSSGSGGVDNPRNAVVGPNGDVYVASRNTLQVLKYSGNDGTFAGVVADVPLSSLAYIEFGDDGLLYASGRTTGVGSDTSLLQIDPESGTILQTLPLGRDGWSFTVGPDNVIYSSGNGSGNYVDIIGPASNATFNVELSKPSALPVTVDFATVDVTATAGSDYSASSGNIVFEPGVTGRTIVVPTLDDAVQETTETFQLALSNAVGANLAVSEANGTIFDDGDIGNQAPTADAGADQTLSDNDGTGSETVTLSGGGFDTDGSIVGYEWTKGATVLGNSASISPSLGIGTHTLTLTVTDNEDATGSDTVVVTVNANQGPSVSAGADQTVSDSDGSGDQIVTLSGSGSDADGSVASYEWTEGATVLGNTASISPTLSVGTHTLTLTVTDSGGATASDNVIVTVVANQGPTANAGSDQSVTDNDDNGSETVTLIGSGSDSDGSVVSYEWTEGATVLGNTASISPSLSVGAHTLTLTVADNGGASSSDNVVITVVESVNQDPTANAGVDQTLSDNDGTGSETVTLVGGGSDPDGTIAGYEWTEGATVLGNTAGISPSLAVGTHILTLTVTDDDGATASDDVTVTVVANQGPTVDAGANQTATDSDANGSETVTLIGSGSDTDGTIASYQWSDGTNVIGNTASISPVLGVGTHTLTLEVTDNGGATASDTVAITVEQPASETPIYVYDIRFESAWGGWLRRAVFAIRSDSNGDGQGSGVDLAAAGVAITVEFNGQTYSGTTDSDGNFRTGWNWRPRSGTYAEVVDLALADHTWDPLALDLEDDSNGDGRPDGVL